MHPAEPHLERQQALEVRQHHQHPPGLRRLQPLEGLRMVAPTPGHTQRR